MRTIHTSFEKQRLKYLQWARRVHAVVGRERFYRREVAVKMGISPETFENVSQAMRELCMLRRYGKSHGMKWQLTKKICEEITG